MLGIISQTRIVLRPFGFRIKVLKDQTLQVLVPGMTVSLRYHYADGEIRCVLKTNIKIGQIENDTLLKSYCNWMTNRLKPVECQFSYEQETIVISTTLSYPHLDAIMYEGIQNLRRNFVRLIYFAACVQNLVALVWHKEQYDETHSICHDIFKIEQTYRKWEKSKLTFYTNLTRLLGSVDSQMAVKDEIMLSTYTPIVFTAVKLGDHKFAIWMQFLVDDDETGTKRSVTAYCGIYKYVAQKLTLKNLFKDSAKNKLAMKIITELMKATRGK